MFHEGLFDMAAVLHKEGEGGGQGSREYPVGGITQDGIKH